MTEAGPWAQSHRFRCRFVVFITSHWILNLLLKLPVGQIFKERRGKYTQHYKELKQVIFWKDLMYLHEQKQ